MKEGRGVALRMDKEDKKKRKEKRKVGGGVGGRKMNQQKNHSRVLFEVTPTYFLSCFIVRRRSFKYYRENGTNY